MTISGRPEIGCQDVLGIALFSWLLIVMTSFEQICRTNLIIDHFRLGNGKFMSTI